MKIPATIFMPITTPQQKIGQVRFFGGDFVTIKLVGDTFDASAKAAQEFTVSENRTFIDPFDDAHVQAGQGTVAYEILEEARKNRLILMLSWFLLVVAVSLPGFLPISRKQVQRLRLSE